MWNWLRTHRAESLAALAIGIVGAASWDILKPLLGTVTRALVALTTLGLTSLRDGIYEDAGRAIGGSARMQSGSYYVIAVFFIAAAYVLIGILVNVSKEGSGRRKVNQAIGATLAASAAAALLGVRSAYVTELNEYALVVRDISAPYVTQVQADMWVSRLRQVSGRTDYLVLINEIQKVGSENGAKFPPISPI